MFQRFIDDCLRAHADFTRTWCMSKPAILVQSEVHRVSPTADAAPPRWRRGPSSLRCSTASRTSSRNGGISSGADARRQTSTARNLVPHGGRRCRRPPGGRTARGRRAGISVFVGVMGTLAPDLASAANCATTKRLAARDYSQLYRRRFRNCGRTLRMLRSGRSTGTPGEMIKCEMIGTQQSSRLAARNSIRQSSVADMPARWTFMKPSVHRRQPARPDRTQGRRGANRCLAQNSLIRMHLTAGRQAMSFARMGVANSVRGGWRELSRRVPPATRNRSCQPPGCRANWSRHSA